MAQAHMRHPEGIGASWRGDVYEPTDGVIVVPVEAAHELQSHGFEIVAVYEDKPKRGRAAKTPASDDTEQEPETPAEAEEG